MATVGLAGPQPTSHFSKSHIYLFYKFCSLKNKTKNKRKKERKEGRKEGRKKGRKEERKKETLANTARLDPNTIPAIY